MAEEMSESWKIRISSGQDAIKRTRFAFLAATIVSVAVIIAEYNSHFSWYVNFALKETFDGKPITEAAQRELIRYWVGSDRVSVALLGVNFGMSDAALLGSLSLYILTLWFFFAARRENHLVAYLLIDASKFTENIKSMVFHGIADYLVFVTVTQEDRPITSLDVPTPPAHKPVFYVRPTFQLLIYLPLVAITFIVFTDVWSLIDRAPLRYPHEQLYKLLDIRECIVLIAMEAIALIVGTATWFLCRSIAQFQKATGAIMSQFLEKHM